MFIPGTHPPGPGGRAAEVYFRGNYNDGPVNNQSSYLNTFTIGTAHPSRLIIMSLYSGHLTANLNVVGSATLDGNAMTRIAANSTTTSSFSAQLWILPWPTGTTADIGYSRAADMGYGHMDVWAAYYLRSHTPLFNNYVATASPTDFSQNVQNGGIVVASGRAFNASGVGLSWNGLTQDNLVSLSGGDINHLAGSVTKAPAGNPRTLECINTTPATGAQVVYGIWR